MFQSPGQSKPGSSGNPSPNLCHSLYCARIIFCTMTSSLLCVFRFKTGAYWTVIMLASTAESTLSSSRSAATDPSLSESSAGRMGISEGIGPHAPGVSTATATGLGTKKAEETRVELRRRLSSSSRCFFSCRMVARSSDRVSIRPEGEKQADHSTNMTTDSRVIFLYQDFTLEIKQRCCYSKTYSYPSPAVASASSASRSDR